MTVVLETLIKSPYAAILRFLSFWNEVQWFITFSKKSKNRKRLRIVKLFKITKINYLLLTIYHGKKTVFSDKLNF